MNSGAGLTGVNIPAPAIARCVKGRQTIATIAGLPDLARCLFLNGLHLENGLYVVDKVYKKNFL